METFTVLSMLDLEQEKTSSLELRCIGGRKGLNREICSSGINRPGLALCGFFEKFAGDRIQIIGRGEFAYIQTVPEDHLTPHLNVLLEYDIPCMIFCYNFEPPDYFKKAAEVSGLPLLVTPLDSSSLTIRILRALDSVFAARKIIHGVFIEVLGMGVLLQGKSGVGKSETAMELLDRGHKLIADDSVLVKCLNSSVLWGYSSNKVLSHHMEVRGLGILDISQIYGQNSIREDKQVEFIIHIEEWDNSKEYNRLGTRDETTIILGVSIPMIVVPVKPGRNIPIIIEAAVLNQRLKSKGFHAAKEFNRNLVQRIEKENARNLVKNPMGLKVLHKEQQTNDK